MCVQSQLHFAACNAVGEMFSSILSAYLLSSMWCWMSAKRKSFSTVTSKFRRSNVLRRFSQSTFVPARAFNDITSKCSWLKMMAMPRLPCFILYSDAYRSTGIRATRGILFALLLLHGERERGEARAQMHIFNNVNAVYLRCCESSIEGHSCHFGGFDE